MFAGSNNMTGTCNGRREASAARRMWRGLLASVALLALLESAACSDLGAPPSSGTMISYDNVSLQFVDNQVLSRAPSGISEGNFRECRRPGEVAPARATDYGALILEPRPRLLGDAAFRRARRMTSARDGAMLYHGWKVRIECGTTRCSPWPDISDR